MFIGGELFLPHLLIFSLLGVWFCPFHIALLKC